MILFLKQDQELIKKYFFSGILDFDDFLTLMTKKMTEKDETEDLQKAFWLFDEDGTGKISRANLDRVAIELGYDPDKMQDELQVYEWKKTNLCMIGKHVLVIIFLLNASLLFWISFTW